MRAGRLPCKKTKMLFFHARKIRSALLAVIFSESARKKLFFDSNANSLTNARLKVNEM